MSLDLASRMAFDDVTSVPEASSKSPRPPATWWGRMTWPVRQLGRWTLRILAAPIRGYLSMRRSMTVASVVILLTSFMTLNVIWGFPWSGMMGGCAALLLGGWGLNRLMQPRMKLSLSLPRSAVAGEPFGVTARLENLRRVPALELRVGWHREGVRDIYPRWTEDDWDASSPLSIPIVRPGDQVQWHGAMCFQKRGVRTLPAFQVASTFPFFLFHYRRPIPSDTTIAITPAPLGADDDPTARLMLAAIGDWAQQLVAGAPVEYVGNREYEVGMPVRRWDFASWARLGRPIVREYQSPSIQAVTLVVDTSVPEIDADQGGGGWLRGGAASQTEQEWEFERLMSIAATAVVDISKRRVQLRMLLTSDSIADSAATGGVVHNEGYEPMLVRLASAKPVSSDVAQERLIEIIGNSRSTPVLILSLVPLDDPQREELARSLPANATYLPIRRNVPTQTVESA
ncbi:DUF58 domain-containing protein [Roseiconus nitratireducens]|uniref:DUF58 domain-containing protein n=1 Tax=Roseiconus nitratireducens TaxID=2605748 RepID=A0A5M6DIX7_9BACT|nr:DUF58 domain-containing protein [Roseiconus nitratireducens]KAA5545215.1 DUF58 domain-containing protein [Roseiconus nitratireducens]